MEFKDYYKILGVQQDATPEQIKKAYRKLARKHHPDISKQADATARMAELNEANEVLGSPERRVAYDRLQSQPHARDGQDFRPPPNWDEGFAFADSVGAEADHSDFFEQLFGRAARRRRADAPHSGFNAQPALRGSDRHASIELDLLDAYRGGARTIALRSNRLDDAGRMVAPERSLAVKIPKGVREGQHIRLAGHGSPGSGGGAAGDLLLEIRFKPDARWRAEGRDVYQRVPLSPWEAMLGCTSRLHTPGGEAEVSFPAGWKRGRKLRLKGRGIPGQSPGDLYLELDLVLPPAATDAERAAYVAMAQAFPAFDPRASTGV